MKNYKLFSILITFVLALLIAIYMPSSASKESNLATTENINESGFKRIVVDSSLTFIDNKYVDDLSIFYSDVKYVNFSFPSLSSQGNDYSNFRYLAQLKNQCYIALVLKANELFIIRANNKGQVLQEYNLSSVDEWVNSEMGFLPFKLLSDESIMIGNVISKNIHHINLENNTLNSINTKLYFTDFAYFDDTELYILYSPMPFSDPDAPSSLSYDLYILDSDMNILHSYNQSKILNPILSVGVNKSLKIPNFTNEFIFWIDYLKGKIYKIHNDGLVEPYIHVQSNDDNEIALDRLIESNGANVSKNKNSIKGGGEVFQYLPFIDILITTDGVFLKKIHSDKIAFIYCNLIKIDEMYAFHGSVPLQDFGSRFDFAFVYPDYIDKDGYFCRTFSNKHLSVYLDNIDSQFKKHFDHISHDENLLMKFTLNFDFMKLYSELTLEDSEYIKGRKLLNTNETDNDNLSADEDLVNIKVFPNPFTSHLSISFSNEVYEPSVSLYNSNGKLLDRFEHEKLYSQDIDLNMSSIGNLPPGSYAISIKYTFNERPQRIIKILNKQ